MDKIESLANISGVYEPEAQRRKPSRDQMNEDMQRMFEDSGSRDDFSLSKLSSQPAPVSSPWSPGYDEDTQKSEVDTRVRDTDIKGHRSDTFPHVHHPLKPKPHHHRKPGRGGSHKRKEQAYTRLPDKEEDDDEKDGAEGKDGDKQDGDKPPAAGAFFIGDDETEAEERWPEKGSKVRKDSGAENDSEEEEPLLIDDVSKPKPIIRPSDSELPYIDDSARKKTRVQFDIGEEEEQPDLESRPRRRRSHKNRRHDGAEDPMSRRHLGSEHNLQLHKSATAPTTAEEAQNLVEHDLDKMTSHRFDDPSAYRRPKVRARSSVTSIIHMTDEQEKAEEQPKPVKKRSTKRKSERQMPIMKKTYDHSPHEVFVELDELRYTDAGLQWKETARWIKYEEDVDDVDNRWGKPHLAFLNFHALFSLRKGLDGGAVLLDLEERDLPNIASRVVDKMIACDQIPPDQREAVIRVLLLRHKHLRENQSSFRLPSIPSRTTLASSDEKLSRSATSGSLDGSHRSSARKAGLSNLFHVNTFSGFRRHSSSGDTENVVSNGVSKDPEIKRTSRDDSYTQIDIDGDMPRKDSGVESRKNKELMKKIPEGAEATAVLVGAVDFLKHPTIAFVRLAEGVMMDNLVEVPIPVRFMFVLLGPFHGEMDYHEVGRSISTLMSDKCFHEVAYRAHSRGQLLSAINEFLNSSIVLPPSDWNNKDLVPVDDIQEKAAQMMKKNASIRSKRMKTDQVTATGDDDGGDKKPPPRDPLVRFGKPFYGLIQDVKIRYPKYLSDFKDGIDGQVAAAAIFIFFAALSAAITFGGMYGDKMDNYIGVGETLLISCVNGMVFALFACQPLLIVGATGPLMIFDMSLYSFAKSYDLDFLSIRVWIGVWMTVFGLLVAAFEAVAIVKKITRFTEEIFSTLVCLIFIFEAFNKLSDIFKSHPLQAEYTFVDVNQTGVGAIPDDTYLLNGSAIDDGLNSTTVIEAHIANGTVYNATNAEGQEIELVLPPQPNTALLSMIIMIGTFLIAYKLKHFRNSKFLGRSVRRALGDFGVPISIVLMVMLDYFIDDTYTDKLTMPEGIKPSNPAVRGWLINPMGVVKPLPVWAIFMAAPASLLLFFLIFLEENICHLILGKPERNMKKGSGFHFDIVISCFINFISGLFGAPFMGPACVRTVSHTSALTVMSSTHAPGESPKIVGVKEQRLSAFIVSLLIGLSVLLASVLNLVPKPVLFGIFLYMGVSSTAGIQFLERLVLVLMPVKHHPTSMPYVKKVRTWKMHAFTGIQLTMLIVLWIVQKSPAALCFPFVLMLLIPIRLYLLPYGFNNQELNALDGKEATAGGTDKNDEPDFFEEPHAMPTHVEHPHQS